MLKFGLGNFAPKFPRAQRGRLYSGAAHHLIFVEQEQKTAILDSVSGRNWDSYK